MNIQKERPNTKELDYIAAMSRKSVVDAYKNWEMISNAEHICLDEAFCAGCKVLDLGCGAGRFAKLLGDKAGVYLGVDASAEMIDAAREKYPDLNFIQSDIIDFRTDDDSWDLILLMGNVIDGLQPRSRRKILLEQCKNWLKNDGKIIGSSHLTKSGEKAGFYKEDYHGAAIENYRGSLTDHIFEIEKYGFEIMLCCRDYRIWPADWCYWLAQKFIV